MSLDGSILCYTKIRQCEYPGCLERTSINVFKNYLSKHFIIKVLQIEKEQQLKFFNSNILTRPKNFINPLVNYNFNTILHIADGQKINYYDLEFVIVGKVSPLVSHSHHFKSFSITPLQCWQKSYGDCVFNSTEVEYYKYFLVAKLLYKR